MNIRIFSPPKRFGNHVAACIVFISCLTFSNRPVQAAEPMFGLVVTQETPLNVRSGPGTEYPIIGKAAKDTALLVTDNAGEWAQVRLPDGSAGYAASAYLDIPASQHPPRLGIQAVLYSDVFWLAFSPDGRWLVCPDGRYLDNYTNESVIVWDVQTGKAVSTLISDFGRVTALSFSPDGKWLAMAASDRDCEKMVLWEFVDGTAKQLSSQCVGSREESVPDVEFSPDGRLLAYTNNKTASIWDVATHAKIQELTIDRHFTAVTWNPDNRTLACHGLWTDTRLWDRVSNTIIQTFENDTTEGDALGDTIAFSLDGRFLASNREDDSISIWDVHEGHLIRTLTDDAVNISSVAFTPDGKYLISGSDRGEYGGFVKI